MPRLGRILIADDEETFSQSTADLLRREGYECNCAPDGEIAAAMLTQTEYDLLIADIKMPGNPELELIKKLTGVAQGIPVILVTGYPSLRTAIQSVQLPVVAYLTKPIELEELRTQVKTAIEAHRIYQTIHNTRRRLEESCTHLDDVEKMLQTAPGRNASPAMNNFIELTFQNILGALSDLHHLTGTLGIPNGKEDACHLLNCPKLDSLTTAVNSTIDVLEQTKHSFKSKELGELRKKLETIIKDNL
jgi:DNA-binding response OmpR family regulator